MNSLYSDNIKLYEKYIEKKTHDANVERVLPAFSRRRLARTLGKGCQESNEKFNQYFVVIKLFFAMYC